MNDKPPPRNLLRYSSVGIEFLVVFLLFFFAGWQLDRWLVYYKPAITILFAIVGFSAAMMRLWKQGWGIMKSARRGEDADGNAGPGEAGQDPPDVA